MLSCTSPSGHRTDHPEASCPGSGTTGTQPGKGGREGGQDGVGGAGTRTGGGTSSWLPSPGPPSALPTQLPLATPGGKAGGPAQPTRCRPTPTHGGLGAGQ